MNNILKFLSISLISSTLLLSSCSKENNADDTGDDIEIEETQTSTENAAPVDDGKGVGPVKSIDIPDTIDAKLVAEGKAIFDVKCVACHNLDSRKVGPALKDVTKRRKPEWIMNMIMNPAEMTQKDPTAKKLLGEYMTQMADQNVSEKEARSILEFFREDDK